MSAPRRQASLSPARGEKAGTKSHAPYVRARSAAPRPALPAGRGRRGRLRIRRAATRDPLWPLGRHRGGRLRSKWRNLREPCEWALGLAVETLDFLIRVRIVKLPRPQTPSE